MKSHLRLWLYIAANTLPTITEWITNTFDLTPRGLLILTCKTLLTMVITTRAYLDSGGVNSVPSAASAAATSADDSKPGGSG
jgi:hypothetical protein